MIARLVGPARLVPCRFVNARHVNLNAFTNRTHTCGELSAKDEGRMVHLCGWLQHSRLKGRFFILRDSYGKLQCFVDIRNPTLAKTIKSANVGAYLRIDGVVRKRPKKDVNVDMDTGEVELHVGEIEMVNNPPETSFVQDFMDLPEDKRMRFRHLELRRDVMQYNLRLRSKDVDPMSGSFCPQIFSLICQTVFEVIQAMRNILIDSYGFVDVDTPLLFKQTPGGAEEFIVPSAVDKGRCYSLPQSPQQFKQILMVAGMDRYFQIAKCFRNEHIHRDRQPEFTQLDLELTCPTLGGIRELVENVIIDTWDTIGHLPFLKPEKPFPIMTYEEAMKTYGSDKPDTRFGWKLSWSSAMNACRFFPGVLRQGKELSNLPIDFKSIDHRLAQQYPSAAYICYGADGKEFHKHGDIEAEPTHRFSHVIVRAGKEPIKKEDGLMDSQSELDSLQAAGLLRLLLADEVERHFQLRFKKFCFLWVVDFPLFSPKEEGGLESSHHPFTAPIPEHLDLLKTNPAAVIGQHLDLVLNGTELGGGSIRIHDPELQKYVLEQILRIDSTPLSHLLKVLRDGAPPHGGIALGLDRYLAILTKSNSIRDVIAFPKTKDGRDVLVNAPEFVSEEKLTSYGLKLLDC